MMKRLLSLCCAAIIALSMAAQTGTMLPQQNLARWDIGTANFSGIAPLGGDRYAVVSDKEPEDGFFLFRLPQNRISGEVVGAFIEGFFRTRPEKVDAHGISQRDTEGVAFVPNTQKVWISGEGDQAIRAYTLQGQATGEKLAVPARFASENIYHNCGFEALTYDTAKALFWTTAETSLRSDGKPVGVSNPLGRSWLRLQSFGSDLQAAHQYAYQTDAGTVADFEGNYIHGVPALCALPDGRLLVMEREGYFPKKRIGSWVKVKIYAVRPQPQFSIAPESKLSALPTSAFLEKTLVVEWETRMNLTRYDLANYEGMCLGARLDDGRQTVLCINDSQAGMGNGIIHLKDYVRVVVLPN